MKIVKKNRQIKPFLIASLLSIFLVCPTWLFLGLNNLNLKELDINNLNNLQEIQSIYFEIEVFLSIVGIFVLQYSGYCEDTDSKKKIELILIIELFVGLMLYILSVYLNFPKLDGSTILVKAWQPPTLLYLILIIWILTVYFAGITYVADKFSSDLMDSNSSNKYYLYIPVVIILIIFSACSYGIWGVDHFFKLETSYTPVKMENYKQDFQEAIWNRLCNEKNEKNEKFDINKKQTCNKDKKEQSLVVVAASGGGIQASGWMTQVLAGLQDQKLGIGEDFTKAIGLISSTSGGSVGSMFYLNQFEKRALSKDKDGRIKQGKNGLIKVVENSTDDWLNSVGWGLAFPDLFRAIGLPIFLQPFRELGGDNNPYLYLDRGYALEKNWQKT